MRRVVITGMGGVSALGDDWASIRAAMAAGRTAIRVMPEWERFADLNTRLGAPVDHFQTPAHYSRRALRSMGRVARMSVRASEVALDDAGLLDDVALLRSGAVGVAYGSSSGSIEPVCAFGQMMTSGSMAGVNATSYIQMMSHTAAVNIGTHFGLRGRIIPTSSACTSGSQAIGYAYESIRFGRQKVMVAGGSEEISPATAAVFDTLFATSTRNSEPECSPRPFDVDRDGLVIGEGASTLILEEREHALARGARIYAEVVGFGCNADGVHITQPEMETMAVAMAQALEDARLSASAVGYVCGHGTATERGDIAESHATASVLGEKVPMASLKGHFGHTLGACGAMEAWLTIEMMRDGWFAATANLARVAPECAALDYIAGAPRVMQIEFAMSNNFAFGGINTSLLFKTP